MTCPGVTYLGVTHLGTAQEVQEQLGCRRIHLVNVDFLQRYMLLKIDVVISARACPKQQ